jgi:hypothetical protein
MPKRTGRKRGQRGFAGSNLPERRSVIVPFRQMYFYGGGTSAARMQNLAIPGSAMGDRISEIGDNFLHWRLRRLHVESVLTAVGTVGQQEAGSPLATQYTGSGVIHSIAFAMVDSSKISATPTILQASQLPCFQLGNGLQKLTFTVPPRVLMKDAAVPWLETQTTGSESGAFQIPAFVWSAMALDHDIGGNIAQYVIIEGEVEFRDPCDSTVSLTRTPARPVIGGGEEEKTIVRDEDEDFTEYMQWKEARSERGRSSAVPAPAPAALHVAPVPSKRS